MGFNGRTFNRAPINQGAAPITPAISITLDGDLPAPVLAAEAHHVPAISVSIDGDLPAPTLSAEAHHVPAFSVQIDGTLPAPVLSAEALLWSVVGTGQPTAEIKASAHATGTATLSLATSLTARTGTPRVYLHTRLWQRGQATAQLATSAGAIVGTSKPAAGITARTYHAGTPTARILARVIGEIDWSDVAVSQRWSAATRIGGVEVLTTGKIEIEAEESSARICTLSVVGPPVHDVGAAVEVDLVVGDHVEPLFRGVVTEPQFDPANRATTYEASDQFQQRVDELSRQQIEALTPEASTTQGNEDQGWGYLRHRLESWPGSVDLTRDGRIRATRWDQAQLLSQAVPAAIDGSERLSLVRADHLRNRIDLEGEASWVRWAENLAEDSWRDDRTWCDLVGARGADDADGEMPPTVETIEEALESAEVASFSVSVKEPPKLPWIGCSGQIVFIDLPWAINSEFAASAAWRWETRYTRSMQVGIEIDVSAPSSLSRYGNRMSTQSINYRHDIDSDGFEGGGSWSPDGTDPLGDEYRDTLRDDQVDAVVTDAVNRASRQIAESHRMTQLTVTSMVRPDIERHHRMPLSLPFVEANGKLSAIRHELDTDTGSATTEITVSLFTGGSGTRIETDWSGVSMAELALDKIPTRDPLHDAVIGIIGEPAAETDERGFSLTTPTIELPDQDRPVRSLSRSVTVSLPADELTYI